MNVKENIRQTTMRKLEVMANLKALELQKLLRRDEVAGGFILDKEGLLNLLMWVPGLGDTGQIVVTRQVGSELIVIHPPDLEAKTVLAKAVLADIVGYPADEMERVAKSFESVLDHRGQEVLAAWYPVPNHDWGILIKQDASEALARVATFTQLANFVGFLAIILIVLMAFAVSKSLTDPIKRLMLATKRIGEGQLEHRVEIESSDEIGQLGTSINNMAANLQKLTHGLETTNKELKKAILEFKRSNADLEQFAHSASHDLQEPLRMVSSFMSLLENDYKDKLDDQGREYIAFAVGGATRMRRLIKDLLTFSRAGRIEMIMEKVNLSQVVQNAIENMKTSIEESHAVLDIGPMPSLNGHEGQLTQVFQNLIDNGIKYRGDEEPKISIKAVGYGSWWTFQVQDNGIGIGEQYLEKIFMVFKRLHAPDEYSGTGIGLSIVKRIVERHGGTIWANSKAGEGTTIFFKLPGSGEEG